VLSGAPVRRLASQGGAGARSALSVRYERARIASELHDIVANAISVIEGLTNALRHSAGAAVRVRVRGDREGLLVEVANAPAGREPTLAGAGTGTGLQGLRERVGACGGVLEAVPTSDGGWRLTTRLRRRVVAGAS
jgi:signal transduction histidine kinase